MIAPDSQPQRRPRAASPPARRSGSRRSSSTTAPIGFATDGTPVDCVRFAELGLIGDAPELIVSGINHGSNLGDDITYSGTVAAALEGIVLGIPAIAVSQQSADARDGLPLRAQRSTSTAAARFAARLVARARRRRRCPAGTLLNVNCPAGEPTGVEVTRLGKRLYNDELKLVDEDDGDGRRRYQIYGFEPASRTRPGTDLAAIAAGGSRSRRSTSTSPTTASSTRSRAGTSRGCSRAAGPRPA